MTVPARPHRDRTFLYHAYHVRGQSLAALAWVCGVSSGAIRYQFDKHDIDTRSRMAHEPGRGGYSTGGVES